MREAVHDMAQRLAARDEAVAAELHAFQHQQLAKQEQELSEARAAAEAAAAAADTLRDALLAVHTALSPHSLASVLGFSDRAQAVASLSPQGYEELTSRLLGQSQGVTAADGEAVAARVRELLAQVRGTHLLSNSWSYQLGDHVNELLSCWVLGPGPQQHCIPACNSSCCHGL